MKRTEKRGFTLVEVMLATVIAVFVFAAMGMVLSKSFSLWLDAMANWRLAQYASLSRQRILHGGSADPRDGLMSATSVVATTYSGQNCIEYRTMIGTGGVQRICGWDGTSTKLWLNGGGNWVDAASAVVLDSFTVNGTTSITYRLSFSAVGKTFALTQTIPMTNLVNMN